MDETKVTDESQIKDSTVETTEEKVEGTMGDTLEKSTKVEPKVVPEAAFLDLKRELKELKKEMKEASASEKKLILTEGMNDLVSKYPDVSSEFIQDMLNSATTVATKKIEEKYSPIIEKQEEAKREEAIDKAFNNLFNQAVKENPDLPKNIDKELIKTLAMTPKYINTPMAEILAKVYPVEHKGKSSSEDNMRSGSDKIEDIVSFDKVTEEQRKALISDPKGRAKYFAWLDTQSFR